MKWIQENKNAIKEESRITQDINGNKETKYNKRKMTYTQ